MKFLSLENKEQLQKIIEAKDTQIIFKHNTTCPISKGVLRNIKEEENELPEEVPFYILDLLTYRSLSDAVTDDFDIPHQSPQLLIIKNGKCLYNQSLYDITPKATAQALLCK